MADFEKGAGAGMVLDFDELLLRYETAADLEASYTLPQTALGNAIGLTYEGEEV